MFVYAILTNQRDDLYLSKSKKKKAKYIEMLLK